MSIDIFLSAGKTSTEAQERFVQGIEAHLQRNGMSPRTVGRTEFSSEQPLRLISRLIDECSGTVIVAFERTHISRGLERRGSGAEKGVAGVNLPTVWNQIEAAMAYSHFHPLLVIVEKGVKPEGLLESGYDWYVQEIDLDLSSLNTPSFQGIFADWKMRVEKRHAAPQDAAVTRHPESMTLGEWLTSLTVPQLWKTAAALLGLLVVVASAAFTIGRWLAGGGS